MNMQNLMMQAKKMQKDIEKAQTELESKNYEGKSQMVTAVISGKGKLISLNIDMNDLNTKANMAKKFLTKGDKVKVSLRFRGREMAHMNASKHILDDIAENLSDVAVVEKAPKVEGRSIGMVLAEKR